MEINERIKRELEPQNMEKVLATAKVYGVLRNIDPSLADKFRECQNGAPIEYKLKSLKEIMSGMVYAIEQKYEIRTV